MAGRPKQSLMDYMVIGISPALIMTLVGSLVFFLLTVSYHGQFQGRLMFIFAMFVMAIVLIARISMEEGIEYATLFAIPLGIVTAIAMVRFVRIEGPLAGLSMPINLCLMALIWWSAHKLTWDCTLIDDKQDASGEGLLQGMGFVEDTIQQHESSSQEGRRVDRQEAEEPATDSRASQPDAARNTAGPLWWQRLVDRRHRPHTPGVWVVYYSIVALALFGMGQLWIPASEAAARLAAFRYLVVYVASALGLLLTTSFLGLRRYLRQRGMQMPGDMAGIWLGIGTIVVLALLVFCILLPRPGAAVSVSQLPFRFGSPQHTRTHSQAMGPDGLQQPNQGAQGRSQSQPTGKQPPPRPGGNKQTGSPKSSDSPRATRSGSERARQSTQQGDSSRRSQNSDQTPPSSSSPGKSPKQSSQSGERHSPHESSRQGEQPSDRSQTARRSNQQQSRTKTSHGDTRQSRDERSDQPNGQDRDSQPQAGQQQSPQRNSSQQQQDDRRPDQRPGDSSQNSVEQDDQRSDQQKPSDRDAEAEPSDRQRPGNRRTEDRQERAPSSGNQKSDNRDSRGTTFQRDRSSNEKQAEKTQSSNRTSPSSRSGNSSFSLTRLLNGLIGGLGTLLKLLFWGALLCVLLFFGWKYRDRVCASS